MKLFSITLCVIFLMGMDLQAAEIANVNGKSISDQDLVMSLGGLNEGQRNNVLKDSNSRRQLLNSLIDQELIYQQAEKEQLDKSKEYQDALLAFKKQYMVNLLIQKKLGTKLSEKAAQDFYKTNKYRFTTDQAHAYHILLDTPKEANDALQKAKKSGTDFQELAVQLSKDPSAKNNRGDLGFFTRDRMVPEFTDAVFNANKGDVIGPIKTAYGYHVIKVIEKKSGKTLDYDEVELRVKNELRQDLVQTYVTSLKKGAQIKRKD